MAKWNKIVITNAGYQLSAATLAGNTIRYTRAQTTDKDMSGLTSEQLKEITKLESVVQDLPLGTVSVQDDHTVNVPIKVMNSDLQEDYLLYGIAIFAKIEGGEEILYGIATSVNPDLIPAQNGSTVVGTTFKVKLHVGDAANVTIVVSPDGSVSNEELESILSNYVLKTNIDEMIPDTLTDSTKAEHITGPWDFEKVPTVNDADVATKNDLKNYIDKDSLLIGGRNYFLNSDFSKGLDNWLGDLWKIDSTTFHGDGVVTATPTKAAVTGENSINQDFMSAISNQTVIVSFWAKASVTGANFHLEAHGGYSKTDLRLTKDWKRYSYKLTLGDTGRVYIIAVDAGTQYWLSEPQIELGDFSTDYSPNPDDNILPENVLTADNIADSLPSDLVYSDKDVTVSGQFTFDKAPKLSNGATLSTSDDAQKLVDQIADLKGQIDAQMKWVTISQADYDTTKANGALDSGTAYLIY